MIRAFVINKFRGDHDVLDPGLTELTHRTSIPFAGVLPWLPDLWLDAEDTLEVGRWRRASDRPDALRIAVIRLPRVSNVTDVDALAAEPGVEVLVTTEPSVVAGADLAIVPGSRSTVADLAWLRERGLAERADGPGPEERSRAGDLRRLPDAGGADRRRRGIPRRPGTGPRSAAGLDHLR